MFLCDPCHGTSCPRGFIENLMRSHGKCEGCGRVAACVDCQGYKMDLPITDERPKERIRWKCWTCNQLLNPTIYSNKPTTFRHPKEPVGHEAVPVPVIETDQPATLVCDFCTTPNPTWLYPCVLLNQAGPDGEAITSEMIAVRGDEAQVISFREDNPDWYACQDCHDLIEAGEQVKLAIRSIELYREGKPLAAHEQYIVNLVTQAHSRFWQTRNGPAQAVTVPTEDA